MQVKVKMEKNTKTGGVCATFNMNEKWYYADLSRTFDHGNECMIFPCENEKGEGVDWLELYCQRGIPITSEALTACITQFVASETNEPFQLVLE